MLKKILIGIGSLVLVLVLVFAYMNYNSRKSSPPSIAELDINDLHIEINYSRPAAKGRLIFGPEDDGALQPYGKYWRLGANEATEMTVSQDITFNGMPLKAGTYTLYAVPGADSFQIGVNSELGNWGAWEPDYSKNLFVTEVPVTQLVVPVEQFTTRIENGPDNGAVVYFEWSNVQLAIPIGVNP